MYSVPKFHSNTWSWREGVYGSSLHLALSVTFHGESINVSDFLAVPTAPREQQEFTLYDPRCFVKSLEVWYLKHSAIQMIFLKVKIYLLICGPIMRI